MTTKLFRVWVVVSLIAAIGLVSTSTARLQVNQIAGFGASDTINTPLQNYMFRVQNPQSVNTNIGSQSVAISRNMIAHMSQRSYWPKILYLYTLVGNNLGASLIPLKYKAANYAAGPNPSGVDLVNVGSHLSDSDQSLATGVNFNGTNQALDCNQSNSFKMSNLGSSNSGGMFCWVKNLAFTGGTTEVMGMNSNSGERYVIDLRASSYFGSWGLVTNDAAVASGATDGFYALERASSTSRILYKNGSSVATNTTLDTAAGASDRGAYLGGAIYIASSANCKCLLLCAGFDDGTMTAQDETDFYNDLQTYLITPTGR